MAAVTAAAAAAAAAARGSIPGSPRAAAAAAAAAAQAQSREADVRALADLSAALDRKEAVLHEVRMMNNEAEKDTYRDDAGNYVESFQRMYVM